MNYNIVNLKEIYKKVDMDKSKHREGRKVSAQIRREIIKEINTTAYVLYEYYIEKAEAPDYDLFNDSLIGKILGLTPRTVKEYRIKLQKTEFIYFTKRKADDVEVHKYIIGKDRVTDYLAVTDAPTEDED